MLDQLKTHPDAASSAEPTTDSVAHPIRSAASRTIANVRRTVLGVAGVVVWLACWEWATAVGPLAAMPGLPTMTSTFETAIKLGTEQSFWVAIWETCLATLIALLAALVIGLIVGVITGLSSIAFSIFDPLIQFIRPLPPVVLLPLVLLLMGPSPQLAVFLAAFAATWPILIQVQTGVRSTDPVALETAKSMTLPWWRTQVHVVIPSALPNIATGVRIGAAASLMLTVGAGILAGTPGIGRLVVVAQETGQASMVFAIILWSGALGLVLAIGLGALERKLTKNSAREMTA